MKKQQLIKKVQDIIMMNEHDLNLFALELSLSMIDNKARKFLQEAIDIRHKELERRHSLMAECSEYRQGEVSLA